MSPPVTIDECLSHRDGRLFVEQVPASALVERFGSPLFVLSENQVRRNVRRYRQAFARRWRHGVVRVMPAVKANKTRLFAVSTPEPSPLFPNLPAIAQSGVPGYSYVLWWGIFAPAGTPKEIVALLNREIVKVMALPDVKQKFEAAGIRAVGTTPEQFGEKVRRDAEKYRKIILESNMQQEQ